MRKSDFPVPVSGTSLERATAYQLIIHLISACSVNVGALGPVRLPAGVYVYTGSARRNIAARLIRHLAPEKTLRWHIDYLLACKSAKIARICLSIKEECELNQSLTADIPVQGFGASDCRAGCGSHLKFLGQQL